MDVCNKLRPARVVIHTGTPNQHWLVGTAAVSLLVLLRVEEDSVLPRQYTVGHQGDAVLGMHYTRKGIGEGIGARPPSDTLLMPGAGRSKPCPASDVGWPAEDRGVDPRVIGWTRGLDCGVWTTGGH